MKNKIFKKSISLVLTVLMVMSSWVFFPGMIPEASAAVGTVDAHQGEVTGYVTIDPVIYIHGDNASGDQYDYMNYGSVISDGNHDGEYKTAVSVSGKSIQSVTVTDTGATLGISGGVLTGNLGGGYGNETSFTTNSTATLKFTFTDGTYEYHRLAVKPNPVDQHAIGLTLNSNTGRRRMVAFEILAYGSAGQATGGSSNGNSSWIYRYNFPSMYAPHNTSYTADNSSGTSPLIGGITSNQISADKVAGYAGTQRVSGRYDSVSITVTSPTALYYLDLSSSKNLGVTHTAGGTDWAINLLVGNLAFGSNYYGTGVGYSSHSSTHTATFTNVVNDIKSSEAFSNGAEARATVKISGTQSSAGTVSGNFTYTGVHGPNSDYKATTVVTMPYQITVVNKATLRNRYNEIVAQKLQSGNYTMSSWNNFKNALLEAEVYLNNSTADTSNETTLLNNLNAYYSALKRRNFDFNYDNLFSFSEWAASDCTNVNDANRGSISYDIDNGTITAVDNSSYTTSNDLFTSYGFGTNLYKITGIKANTEYAIDFDTSASGGQCYVFYYSDTGAVNGSDGNPHKSLGAASGTKTFTTPAGCTQIGFRFGTAANGASVTFSNIRVYEASKQALIDDYKANGVPARTAYNFGDALTADVVHTPNRPGYTFGGWILESDYSPLLDADTAVSVFYGGYNFNASWILYSDWTENNYNIAFNSNGGTGSTSTINNVLYSANTKLTANSFSRTGYTFTGWNTAANGSGTAIADGATVSKLSPTNGATVTLYAQWSVNSYTVLYDNLFDFNNFPIGNTMRVEERTDTGFTAVSSTNDDANTGFSYAIPVEPGKTYILSADVSIERVEGDTKGYDIYINTLADNYIGETSATVDTANGAHKEGDVYISLSGQTTNTKPYIKFTAGDTTAYIKIRFDANTVGNKLTVNNIRLNEADKVEDSISYHLGKEVTYDSAYGTLPTPTRGCYAFLGWVDEDGNAVTADTLVNTAGNHTLYSTWGTETHTEATRKENIVNETCGSAGSYDLVTYCSNCNKELKREAKTTAATGNHTWDDGVETSAPTCTVAGVMTYTCTVCNATKTEAISAKGHTPGAAATCTAAQTCTVCGAELAAKLAHTEATKEEDRVEATCGKDGSYKLVTYCSVCSAVIKTEPQTIPATGKHTWNDGEVTKDPTCITDGVKTYTCTVCDGTKTESVAATGVHIYGEWTNYTATEHSGKCTNDPACTATITEAHTISDTVKNFDATYHYYKCEKCDAYGALINGTFNTSMKEACYGEGTTFTQIADNATQHTETCKCGNTKTDAHNWAGWVADPENTDDNTGKMSNTCSECGYKKTSDCTYTKTDSYKAPTCTDNGYQGWKCSDCGNGYTEILTATGHKEAEAVNENVVDATCTTDGSYDSVVYCTVCNAELKREKVTVTAEGHKFGETVTAKAATCVATGNEAYKQCTVCNKYFATDEGTMSTEAKDSAEAFTTEIDPDNHDLKTTAAKAPTCTDIGWNEYVTCQREGCDYTTYEEIPAIAHKNKVHHEKVDATCVATGTIEYWSCPDCGKNFSDEGCTTEVTELTIEIAPDNHDLKTTAAKAPTCTDIGWNEYVTCQREGCGYTTYVEKQATGHDYGEWAYDADGNHKRVCANDTKHIETEACSDSATDNDCNCDKCLNLVAHSYGDATCNAPATCTVCGATTGGVLGHDWSAVTYSFVEDGSACTAIRECGREGCDEAETATATITSAVKTPATCTVDGWTTYTATFEEDWAETKTLDVQDIAINANNHVGEKYTQNENIVAGTCISEKTWNEVTYCSDCNAKLSTEAKTGEKDPANHASTETYIKDDKAGNCGVAGYTGDTYHKCCNVLKAKGEEIPATGNHTYGNFSHDEGKSTHSKVCSVCGDTVTEVCTAGNWIISVNATCMEKGSQYKECTVCKHEMEREEIPMIAHRYGGDAVNKEDGKHHYQCQNILNTGKQCAEYGNEEVCSGGTATCTDKAVCSKCNTAYGNVLGHDWSVTYNFAADGKNCTATRICSNDKNHNVTATATITSAVKTPATCTVDGWTTYTAKFEETWAVEQMLDVQDIAALNHNWSVTYDFATDGKTCKATRICANDAKHNVTATATITSAVKTPATCEGMGTTTYTATFSVDWAETKTLDVQDIKALNHDYDTTKSEANLTRPELVDGTWTQGYYTYTCKNDSSHTTLEEVDRAAYTAYEAAWNNLESLLSTDITDEAKTYINKILGENKIADNLIASEQNIVDTAEANLKYAFDQYKGSLNTYTVTFVVDGVETTVTVISGNDATAPTDVKKACDDMYHYEFKEWDRDFTNVTSDITVTAVFDAIEHTYTHTDKDDTYHTDSCDCGYSKDVKHTETSEVTTKASCFADGVITFTCSVCSGTRTETIAKRTHNIVDTTVALAPTCSATGIMNQKCDHTGSDEYEACGYTTTRVMEKVADAHKWETEYTVDTKASCDNAGSKSYHCEYCDTINDDSVVEIAKREHNLIDTTVALAPTCSATGIMNQKCDCAETAEYEACDYTTTRVMDKVADAHKWETEYTVDTKASCDNAGSKSYHCEYCDTINADSVVEIAKREHNLVDTTVALAPTCSATGIMNQKCDCAETAEYKACDYTTTRVIPVNPNAHKAEADYTVMRKATCEADGYKAILCEYCDAELSKETIAKREHNLVDTTVALAPTCSATGIMNQKCDCAETAEYEACDYTTTRVMDKVADAHKWETQYTVDKKASCDNAGSKSYHCEYCDTINADSVVEIAKREHNLVDTTVALAPTCSATGIMNQKCDHTGSDEYEACDYTTTRVMDKVADAHKAEAEYIQTIAPTCSAVGEEKLYCEYCDAVLDTREVAIDKDAHKAEAKYIQTIAPTCSAVGEEKLYCEYCDAVLDTREVAIDKDAHTGAANVIKNAKGATCLENGYTGDIHWSCCDALETKGTEIPAPGHTEATREENRVEPSCGAAGSYDLVTYCTVCTQVIKTEKVSIPATGEHNFVTEVDDTRVPSTCKTPGSVTMKCGCGATEVQTIPVDENNHEDIVTDEAVAPTCTKSGLTEGSHCAACDKVIIKQEEIPALGHKEDKDASIYIAPSCDKNGYVKRVCGVCGEIFGSSTIAPTGHKYTDETGAENFVIVPATCDAKGSKYLVCTVCGYENTKDAVPYGTPSGHYLFIKEGYAPTCTEDGLTEYTYCLREGCDYEIHAKKIPATGHKDNGDGMCSSCGNKLYESGSKSCGCLCHKDSVIMRFIYKIVLFFWKLFRIKHDCGCGSIHY